MAAGGGEKLGVGTPVASSGDVGKTILSTEDDTLDTKASLTRRNSGRPGAGSTRSFGMINQSSAIMLTIEA